LSEIFNLWRDYCVQKDWPEKYFKICLALFDCFRYLPMT
jgi:hypothetical protein